MLNLALVGLASLHQPFIEMEAGRLSLEPEAHQAVIWISFAFHFLWRKPLASERKKFGEVRRGWILFTVWAVVCIFTDL